VTDHFADRLVLAVREKGAPACVGIDPVYERLPVSMRQARADASAAAAALHEFGRRIVDVVAEHVPVVKINVAYFERYRGAGVDAYFALVEHAAARGIIVIGDAKRGDVGHTAELYAHAGLADHPDAGRGPDAITVASYFGIDGVKPFLDVCRAQRKGVFVLVRTSNPSAADVQGIVDAGGAVVSERVASLVAGWAAADGLAGHCGYSAVGAVVSPRDVAETSRLRALMPRSVFLVPGYGAQGVPADALTACFNDDGLGAIVNASRSVIYAYERAERAVPWESSVERACQALIADVRQAVEAR
jgi:orotidine-5'-phosphate decarboxylase